MMAQTTTDISSPNNIDAEMQETAFASGRGCCFWLPCFTSDHRTRFTPWDRLANEGGGGAGADGGYRWMKPLLKVREWSELAAGPKWKTFIRRFNKVRQTKQQGKFQYDPLSYALNFEECPGDNGDFEDDRLYRNFSVRYASVTIPAKSSEDLGKDEAVLT